MRELGSAEGDTAGDDDDDDDEGAEESLLLLLLLALFLFLLDLPSSSSPRLRFSPSLLPLYVDGNG